MPQMAPLLWLTLFKFFFSCLVIFIAITYFIKLPNKVSPLSIKPQLNKLNWKW